MCNTVNNETKKGKFMDQKKSNHPAVYKVIVAVLSIVILGLSGFFIYQIQALHVLPGNLLIPICVMIGLIVVIMLVLWNFYQHVTWARIVLTILNIAMLCVFSVGNFYLYKTNDTLQVVTAQKKEVKNTVSLLVKNDSEIQSIHDLNEKAIGKLNSIDALGTTKMITHLQEQFGVDTESLLPFQVHSYDSVEKEVEALYNNEVQAIILNESYRTNVLEYEPYANFNNEVRSIDEVVYYTKVDNEAMAVPEITKNAFNILISGNDTYGDVGELSRSDVNMVVTVNPQTRTVLLTSIPRDCYVEFVCDEQDACLAGASDKITHTGLHGINTTKKTVENLLGITVNYTFRANFSSVMEIVDAIGGIDVEIPEGMAVETFYANNTLEGVHEGMNHLQGERALAFARERYAYIDGDNQRVRNQQTVLKAIFAKATSPEIIVNYSSLLDAFQGAFDTTLSQDEITTLIKYQIQENPQWKFESYQLTGEGAQLLSPELGQTAYVTVVDPYSIALAHDKIEAVLKGESADSIETPVSGFSSQTGETTTGQEQEYYAPSQYDDPSMYYDPYPLEQPGMETEEPGIPWQDEMTVPEEEQ
ncbi:LCP family protein [uncultured Dubosiella sp.]|uniref:LCP family protein n=3 Tax=uncultured Dubosiella sp. TaxID=1937011 RepID=UPI0026384241|nr:LCP family protein [uncultured Dubosiella sp.]